MVERRKHHIRRYFNNIFLDIEILWLHDKLLFYLLVKKFLKPSKRNTGIILYRFNIYWTYLIIYLVGNQKINLNIISFFILYIILQISIAYPIIRKILNYISYLLFLILTIHIKRDKRNYYQQHIKTNAYPEHL